LPRFGFTLIELLVVIFIMAILIAVLLPAVMQSVEAARRAQCMNNLNQIGLAIHNYEMAHNVYPPGCINPTGPIRSEPLGYHLSWMVQLLPYLDQKNLRDTMDFNVGAYDEKNARARRMAIPVTLCPSDVYQHSPQAAACSYAGVQHDVEAAINHDNHGAFVLNLALPRRAFTDGVSHTLFVGEKLQQRNELGWVSGTRATLRNGGHRINLHQHELQTQFPISPNEAQASAIKLDFVGGFSSPHDGGALFLIGDVSVRFLNQNLDMALLRRLTNRSDGESIDEEFF
jgi:prepilin-type N-terminal cleavage/methylation domain-containing protein